MTAVEPAAPMRARARAKTADLPGVTVSDGALPDLDVDEEFDAVIALHSVLNYLAPDDLERGVQALADHLAPGGVLVVDNSLLPPADEGNAADYVVGEAPGGRYVRVAWMRPRATAWSECRSCSRSTATCCSTATNSPPSTTSGCAGRSRTPASRWRHTRGTAAATRRGRRTTGPCSSVGERLGLPVKGGVQIVWLVTAALQRPL